MSEKENRISRRIFISLSGAIAAAFGLSTSAAVTKDSTAASSSIMPGVSVSLIADALRKIGLDPVKLVMSTDVKPLVNVGSTIIGPAVTCKWAIARSKGV